MAFKHNDHYHSAVWHIGTSEYDLGFGEHVKVISCEQPFIFPGGKQKQDLEVGNKTGTATITLWEENVGKGKMLQVDQLADQGVCCYTSILLC